MTKTRTDRKPPLARSPIRVRSRGVLRPSISNAAAQTQPGSVMITKSMDLEILSNYETISCEIREMAKMAQQGGNGAADSGDFAIPLFRRGKYYDEYSARRDERLRMKQLRLEGVELESPEKKMDLKKCKDKKSLIPRTPLTARRENMNPNPNPNSKPRYLLRSMTKEMKKPASSLLPLDPTSSIGGERKTVSRRQRKI